MTAFFSLTLIVTSCNTSDAVAKFCSSANSSLSSGNAIFQDIQPACVRGEVALTPFTSFDPVPLLNTQEPGGPPQSDPCDTYKVQAEGLQAAGKILANYFVAMNGLASFGTTKLADNTGALAQKVTTTATKLNPNEVGAVQALASLLTNFVSSTYQRKHLNAVVQAADPDIKAVTAGLKRVVNDNYLLELNTDQTNLSQRYQQFLSDHPCRVGTDNVMENPYHGQGTLDQVEPSNVGQGKQTKSDHSCHIEALIMLQDRWQQDLNALAAKRKVADDFVSALDTIAAGHAALAANANGLKAKELPGLLSPYNDELQKLAGAIAKL